MKKQFCMLLCAVFLSGGSIFASEDEAKFYPAFTGNNLKQLKNSFIVNDQHPSFIDDWGQNIFRQMQEGCTQLILSLQHDAASYLVKASVRVASGAAQASDFENLKNLLVAMETTSLLPFFTRLKEQQNIEMIQALFMSIKETIAAEDKDLFSAVFVAEGEEVEDIIDEVGDAILAYYNTRPLADEHGFSPPLPGFPLSPGEGAQAEAAKLIIPQACIKDAERDLALKRAFFESECDLLRESFTVDEEGNYCTEVGSGLRSSFEEMLALLYCSGKEVLVSRLAISLLNAAREVERGRDLLWQSVQADGVDTLADSMSKTISALTGLLTTETKKMLTVSMVLAQDTLKQKARERGLLVRRPTECGDGATLMRSPEDKKRSKPAKKKKRKEGSKRRRLIMTAPAAPAAPSKQKSLFFRPKLDDTQLDKEVAHLQSYIALLPPSAALGLEGVDAVGCATECSVEKGPKQKAICRYGYVKNDVFVCKGGKRHLWEDKKHASAEHPFYCNTYRLISFDDLNKIIHRHLSSAEHVEKCGGSCPISQWQDGIANTPGTK